MDPGGARRLARRGQARDLQPSSGFATACRHPSRQSYWHKDGTRISTDCNNLGVGAVAVKMKARGKQLEGYVMGDTAKSYLSCPMPSHVTHEDCCGRVFDTSQHENYSKGLCLLI